MASKAAIENNEKRKRLVKKYATLRTEYRAGARDMTLSQSKRNEYIRLLAKLPRNSNPNRIKNRCALTGRPRSYYRFFGLSRIAVRDMALRGELPGVRKSSL